jgi:hypothetical protein
MFENESKLAIFNDIIIWLHDWDGDPYHCCFGKKITTNISVQNSTYINFFLFLSNKYRSNQFLSHKHVNNSTFQLKSDNVGCHRILSNNLM